MKCPILAVCLFAAVLCMMMAGCEVYDPKKDNVGGCLCYYLAGAEKPLTGITDFAPDPYKLRITDLRSTQAVVLDQSGKDMGHIVCPEPICGVQISKGVFLLRTVTSVDADGITRYYRYRIGDTKCRLIIDRADGLPEHASDQIGAIFPRAMNGEKRLIPMPSVTYDIYKSKPFNAPKNAPVYPKREAPMKVILLDSRFEQVLSTSDYCSEYRISPNGRSIAWIELSKDEFGDFSNFTLKVAKIQKHRTQTIVTSRRLPVYWWLGDESLAVTTYDSHCIPTLSRFSLASDKLVHLVTDKNAAVIEPIGSGTFSGDVEYRTYPTESMFPMGGETWVVSRGKRLRKLPTPNGMMPGAPSPGMPLAQPSAR